MCLPVERCNNGPAHDKTYNKTHAASEDSDQPAHPRSLIRVFAGPSTASRLYKEG